MKKVYIVKNHINGWKVALSGTIVDCVNPIFHSHDTSENGLKMCRKFCNENNLEVIRECK